MNTKRMSLCVTVVLLASGVASGANITYGLNNWPEWQNGWGMVGSITTNGTLGPLGADDIVAWQWTATKPGETSETRSSGIHAYVFIMGVVWAGPQAITINAPPCAT